jgi:hypothetical protein
MSLSNKLSITDVNVKGKRVLIRVSEGLGGLNCASSAATMLTNMR